MDVPCAFCKKVETKSVKFGLGGRSNISLPHIGGSHPVPSLGILSTERQGTAMYYIEGNIEGRTEMHWSALFLRETMSQDSQWALSGWVQHQNKLPGSQLARSGWCQSWWGRARARGCATSCCSARAPGRPRSPGGRGNLCSWGNSCFGGLHRTMSNRNAFNVLECKSCSYST